MSIASWSQRCDIFSTLYVKSTLTQHNLIMKKSEAVKVVIRIRPPNKLEIDSSSCVEKKDMVVTVALDKNSKEFYFDQVFDGHSKQEDVYETTAFSLVESVAEGYNGTIFAYGQTGAGKTWTMIGMPKD